MYFDIQNPILTFEIGPNIVIYKCQKRKTKNEKRKTNNEKRITKTENEKPTNFTLLVKYR